jgi:hypothetical protein
MTNLKKESTMTAQIPAGQEREVKNIGGAAIDGTPIAYIVVLAAVVTALAFIPFSVVLASGGSFPMNQGIFGLIGWMMGPIAGAVTAGIGALIGVFVAPHTAGIWFITVLGAIVTSFAAGCMGTKNEKRKAWWVGVVSVTVLCYIVYVGRAIFVNGIHLQWAILASFVNWSSLLLFILPTRNLVAKWVGSKNIAMVAVGLALGTWISFGIAHTVQNAFSYTMLNWPEEVWVMLSSVIPFEFLSRCAIAAVIGTGVIAGLRAIGLVKPTEGIY